MGRAVYLAYYPLSYFIERARNGELYGLWGPDGSPRVMAVLLERDSRWPDGGNALYVHNLAADPAVPGAARDCFCNVWSWRGHGGRNTCA